MLWAVAEERKVYNLEILGFWGGSSCTTGKNRQLLKITGFYPCYHNYNYAHRRLGVGISLFANGDHVHVFDGKNVVIETKSDTL